MGIRDFLDRLRTKRVKYKEYEEDMRIQKQYMERQKSANERELERYQNELRERAIKNELEKFRQAKRKEIEYDHQILAVKNMFKGEKHSLLKQQNIFAHKKNQNILIQRRIF